jgi:uncharacterized OsmC-like protein
MAMQDIAAAAQRVQDTLRHRPEAGLHDDPPAVARWQRDLRITAHHPDGMQLSTDMPKALGGTGDQVSPGWLFRAGVCSCAATCIAMAAAREGIELQQLEVTAGSRSDTRGLLGMDDEGGGPVVAGPLDMQLNVKIAAANATPQQLRELVEAACDRSPVPDAVRRAIALRLEVDAGA